MIGKLFQNRSSPLSVLLSSKSNFKDEKSMHQRITFSFKSIIFVHFMIILATSSVCHAYNYDQINYNRLNSMNTRPRFVSKFIGVENLHPHTQLNFSKKKLDYPLAEMFPINIDDNSSGKLTSDSEITISEKGFSKKWIARAILLSVSAFYGTNFGCVKLLGTSLHPSMAAVMRFSIASLVFMPQMIKVSSKNKALILGGIEVGLYNAIGYFAQAQSLQHTSASNAAFICSLAVIVVPLIESLFGEKRGWSYLKSAIVPALLATCGVGCLELGGASLPGVGDVWAMLQPLFFGLGFWRIERHMKNCGEAGEAQAFTGAMMTTVAFFSFLWSLNSFIVPISQYGTEILNSAMLSQFQNLLHDWRLAFAIVWTGIVTTALTAYGENIAMKDLDAAESTVIYSTEPIWGAAFASATLGEVIGWNTVLGAILILCACAWRTVSGQVLSLFSSSALLNNDGLEEVLDNFMMNFQRLLERGLLPTDIPPEL